MLSQQTIDIVKSTVPVLQLHGEAITTCFYKRLFESHPELLNIFNHQNQHSGRQQTALANTIYAAANYIDKLEVLVPVVTQISNKHRGLGVQAAHYPIVGEYLLRAIKEVLGDAATDDIIQAWAEAYDAIADVFINVEQGMYEKAKEQNNGWDGFKQFTVVAKEKESSTITSFYLKPADGAQVPNFTPGQYLTIRVKVPGNQYTANRQYSLSSAPGKDTFRISVKKEATENHLGCVSTYLHNDIEVGDEIEVSAPAGIFTLKEEDAPVAFISGGVGLTPLMSMLESLVENKTTRKVSFIHATKDRTTHAFKKEVQDLISQLADASAYYAYENKGADDIHIEGYITSTFLETILTTDTVCYICGPTVFMEHIIRILKALGLPEKNLHYEFFGPAEQFA